MIQALSSFLADFHHFFLQIFSFLHHWFGCYSMLSLFLPVIEVTFGKISHNWSLFLVESLQY